MKKIVSIVMLFVVLGVCIMGYEEPKTRFEMFYKAKTLDKVNEYIMGLDHDKYEIVRGPYTDRDGLAIVYYREKQTTSTEHTNSWNKKCVDCENVKFCKVEQNTTTTEHSHTWDVKKVDGKIISFCTECGKITEQ